MRWRMAVYWQTGVTGVRSDRADSLNTQVTLRGHCTIHVLRDRQLAANHRSTVLSRVGKNISHLKHLVLAGRSGCRGFRGRGADFNLPLKFAARFKVVPRETWGSLDRNVAPQPCRSVNAIPFFSFSKPSLYSCRCLYCI